MEDTLRAAVRKSKVVSIFVLILVLMEDTLRVCKDADVKNFDKVLILVLMEDTLRDSGRRSKKPIKVGLNPCFNGRYS